MRKSKCDRRAHNIANAKAYRHYLSEMTLSLGSNGRFMIDRFSIEMNCISDVGSRPSMVQQLQRHRQQQRYKLETDYFLSDKWFYKALWFMVYSINSKIEQKIIGSTMWLNICIITQKIKNDHQEGMKRSIRPEIFPVVIPIIVHRFLKQIDSFLSIDCKTVKQCICRAWKFTFRICRKSFQILRFQW